MQQPFTAMTKRQRTCDTTPPTPGPARGNRADGNREPALCWARGEREVQLKMKMHSWPENNAEKAEPEWEQPPL